MKKDKLLNTWCYRICGIIVIIHFSINVKSFSVGCNLTVIEVLRNLFQIFCKTSEDSLSKVFIKLNIISCFSKERLHGTGLYVPVIFGP